MTLGTSTTLFFLDYVYSKLNEYIFLNDRGMGRVIKVKKLSSY